MCSRTRCACLGRSEKDIEKSMSFEREDIFFLCDWVYVFGQKNDCAETADTPSRDHREVIG